MEICYVRYNTDVKGKCKRTVSLSCTWENVYMLSSAFILLLKVAVDPAGK